MLAWLLQNQSRKMARWAVGCAVVALSAGCGGSEAKPANGTPVPDAGVPAEVPDAKAEHVGDAASNPPAGDFGRVSVVNHRYGDERSLRGVVRQVFRDGRYPAGCREEVAGCTLQRCLGYSSHQPYPEVLPAGPATLKTSGEIRACQGSADGFCFFGDSLSFQTGERFDLAFEGAVVPAFEASVTMPAALSMSSPAGSDATPAHVPSGTSLEVRWTPLLGKVRALVLQEGTRMIGTVRDDVEIELECRFDGNAGNGTIPAEALARIDAGHARLELAAYDQADVVARGYGIRVRAENTGGSAVLMLGEPSPSPPDAGVPIGCTAERTPPFCNSPLHGVSCSTSVDAEFGRCPGGCAFSLGDEASGIWGCCCL
jgi:hypothetical protein